MSATALVVSGNNQVVPAADVARWDQERRDLVRRTVCPQGIPELEFSLFEEQCRRTGLDPLLKQCFCVKRKAKDGAGNYVEKYEFQAAEAGMLARAENFPDFRGVQAAPIYDGDACKVNRATGVVDHVEILGAKRGKLMGAWGRVERAGRTPVVVFVPLELVQQEYGSFWKKSPEHMVVKCARVAALRTSYPAQFGGVYSQEEMPHEEEAAPPRAHQRAVASAEMPAATVVMAPAPEVKALPPPVNVDREPGSDDDAVDVTPAPIAASPAAPVSAPVAGDAVSKACADILAAKTQAEGFKVLNSVRASVPKEQHPRLMEAFNTLATSLKRAG